MKSRLLFWFLSLTVIFINLDEAAGGPFPKFRYRRQNDAEEAAPEAEATEATEGTEPPTDVEPSPDAAAEPEVAPTEAKPQNATAGPKSKNSTANMTLITLDPAKANYVDAFLKCMVPAKLCSLTSLGAARCSIACLLDPFSNVKHTLFLFNPIIYSLCKPLGTMFDKNIGLVFDYHHDIKRFSKFVHVSGNSESVFGKFSKDGALALPFQLIKYGDNPILNTLKPVVGAFSQVVDSLPSIPTQINQWSNPECGIGDMLGPHQALAQAVIQSPYTADLALPGWFVAMNSWNLELGQLNGAVGAFRKIFKFFSGVECSLIQYASSGSASDCVSVLGKMTPLPNASRIDQEFICGSVADLPEVDLHKLLPDVWPGDWAEDVTGIL